MLRKGLGEMQMRFILSCVLLAIQHTDEKGIFRRNSQIQAIFALLIFSLEPSDAARATQVQQALAVAAPNLALTAELHVDRIAQAGVLERHDRQLMKAWATEIASEGGPLVEHEDVGQAPVMGTHYGYPS